MESNKMDQERTDDAPIKPVSSLLSHFEHLSTSGNSSKYASSLYDASSGYLKSTDNTEQLHFATRGSLDLPRPRSPWGAPANGEDGQRRPLLSGGQDTTPTNASLGRGRRSRPMSMLIRSSSQLTPVLMVDSICSPPQSGDSNQANNSLSRGVSNLSPSSMSWQNPRSLARSMSQSPPLPRSPSVSPGNPTRGTSPIGILKSASVPPPVNRADKPKIPTKPPSLGQGGLDSRSPFERKASVAKVSPFSTPPSSPEKIGLSNFEKEQLRDLSKPAGLSRPYTRSPLQPSVIDKPSRAVPLVARTVNVGDHRLLRPQTMTDPPRDTKLGIESRSKFGRTRESPVSSQKSGINNSPEDRPSLPPRLNPQEKLHHGMPARNLSSGPLNSAPRDWNAETNLKRAPNIEMDPQFAPPLRRNTTHKFSNNGSHDDTTHPPPFSRDSKYTNSTPSNRPRNLHSEDSNDEATSEEVPIPLTDYPDSTQVNRRPPHVKFGPSEIATKYDTRVFDVCGKHVCTAGFLTRIWDLTTGDQIMSLSHGETVKVLTVAFKPSKGVEDEGSRLWLGTSIGELHEVDLHSQSIVASRSYPSRREVTTIHRHKKEMWTIDDEGRLLVWPPDETGTPNLQYSPSHPYDRVAKGHALSLVAADTLWLAIGKDIRIYRPNSHDESFHVLKKPLGSIHTGDVTSGTYTTREGGRVYLGHADGKITVYSSTDYTCIMSISVSVYKINCLAMVGDHLWAAFKTGMVYVYDLSTTPWTVKKDWHAHNSPVCGLLLDPSSIWTLDRLQVASLGTDNYIRLWDGMLEDDWLEARMQSKDVEYCTFREVRASVVTWNAGASIPRDLHNSSFIRDAIHPEDPPEILVFGFQELVDLEDKKITAKSLLMGSKKKDNHDKEHISRQYRVWKDHLASSVNETVPLEESYSLVHTANLVGLFTCVFVKQKERQRVRNICSAEVKRGIRGLHGNKGALILRFVIDDSSICFVNCHLAAGQTQTTQRHNDIAAILEYKSLPAEHSVTSCYDLFVGGGDGAMILDHEICILNGDLNYRIDSMPRNTVIEAIRNNNLPKLLERDQLLASKRKNPGFRLRSFNEAPITFPPTYKYDIGTDEYDSSEKKRAPAWCDRVLYRGVGRIKQIEYRRHEVRVSDHRPVSALFKLRLKAISPKERAATWEGCQREFAREEGRILREASIQYLINVLGTDPHEARSLITSGGSQ